MSWAMDMEAVSPKSQPVSNSSSVPELSLPGSLLTSSSTSRDSTLSTIRTEGSWPPKWDPAWGCSLSPPSSFEDLLGKDTSLLYLENRLKSLQGLEELDQNAEDPGTTALWQKCVTQTQRILRKHHPSRKLQAKERAISNCRKTIIVLNDLTNLLTTLLTAQIASGCKMEVQNQTGDNDAWVVEVLMRLKAKQGTVDPSPKGVYALQRLCKWVCNQAADDLADIDDQTTSTAKRTMRFINKWDDFPASAFENMVFKYADTGTPIPAGENDTQTQQPIISSCLNFLDDFNHVNSTRRPVRVREYDDADDLRKLLLANDNNDKRDGLQQSRCIKNIDLVHSLLARISIELDAETTRRDTCTHPNLCKHVRASRMAIYKAQRRLATMILALIHTKDSLRDVEGDVDEKVVTMRRWVSLATSGWIWGCVMDAQEIVERVSRGDWLDGEGMRERVG